jgi:radical SAM protein with 4Fe4S-binding SPASM domain
MRPQAEHSGQPMTDADGPALRLVFWETTPACNLECVHCRRLEVAHELAKNDLTTAEGKALLDDIASTGRPIVVFSGGEPLMRPDLFELAAHAKARGLPTALATNGTLIDDAMACRIADAGFHRVSVSLDGARPETHDRFRQQPGSFDRAVRALERLRDVGVATQLNCTIARHNQQELGEVLALAGRVGAVAAHYFLLVPVGCGEEIADEQMLSAEEVEVRLTELYALSESTDIEIKATCAPHYYRIVRQKVAERRSDGGPGAGGTDRGGRRRGAAHPGHHRMTKGCLAGTAVCFVSHEGDVFPCGYLPVAAGNVRREAFSEIWRSSEVFARLREPDLLTGKCGACEFRKVCSGCRARAFYQYGDFLGEEPLCAYEPKRRSRPA